MHNHKILTQRRKELRNNSTIQEKIVWSYVRSKQLGYKFRRQHSINSYIVDFCCPEKKIIIEIDGSQHLDNKEYDDERTRYLMDLGYKVLRFWNNDINKHIKEVVMEIEHCLNTTPPRRLGTPPFKGGEV